MEEYCNKTFLVAKDISDILHVSVAQAYKIMAKLNSELKAQGYMTQRGRVHRRYFEAKYCYK